MRVACDTGGTFTDLLVEDDRVLRIYKAHTVPHDPSKGILDALCIAATDRGVSVRDLLGQCEVFLHGTTHAINAVITGRTARTAFLTTAGHLDVLTFREGGRADPFDHTVEYPEPYVPRSLTFEVEERIDCCGSIDTPLNEAQVAAIAHRLAKQDIEAVAICFLWSIVNPAHELRAAEIIRAALPDVAVSLSHQVNPILREYRRASATAINASLKPIMTGYLGGIEQRLRAAGFAGRVLILTSQGGTMDASDIAEVPIQAINSGPSMAPVAGRYYAKQGDAARNVIVTDAGGTTYDVSVVRDERIPRTRETWIGGAYRGHMTGFASVEVKSVGAGGGSIAWVDNGGVLHVGPMSAGADPGPACYGRGGVRPTVTDACVALGYIDPNNFLGGSQRLDPAAARKVIEADVARPLRCSIEEAAIAVFELVTENMVQAIADITINQGIDPQESVLLGGGGAGGLNSVLIARRLGCPVVLFPETGAALSAAGALIADLSTEYRAACFTSSDRFDYPTTKATLDELRRRAREFIEGPGKRSLDHRIQFFAEARYPNQVWELEVPLGQDALETDAHLADLVSRFHAEHLQVFAISDPESPIEIVSLSARVHCRLRDGDLRRLDGAARAPTSGQRRAYFPETSWVQTRVLRPGDLNAELAGVGPAIIESPYTTIVINPGARFHVSDNGSILVSPRVTEQ